MAVGAPYIMFHGCFMASRYRDWFFVAYFDLRPFVRSEALQSF